MDAIEINIRTDISLIPIPLGAVREYAKSYFKDEKTVERIVLALEEALNNVFNYSMSGILEQITVTADANDGEFTVSVIDKGIPGNYESTLEGDDRIGLTIMQNSVDEIYIENLGFGGRRQKLVKYYCSIPATSVLEEKAEEKPLENIEITVRSPKKNEMLNISRAFYNAYGLTYINDTFYYPERLYAAISKGKIYSTIAVDQYGGFAGHHGTAQWSIVPGIWETGMAVVNGNYRNMGILNKMMARTNNYVQNEVKSKVSIGCCITTHPFSQKMRLKFGSSPCAFGLGFIPGEFARNSFNEDAHPTSEAIAASVYDFTPKTVYLSRELTEPAEFIYNGLKLEREILCEGENEAKGVTISKCAYNNRLKNGEINLEKIGSDYESRLNSDLVKFKEQGAETATLYFSIQNPESINVYEAAKKQGFFFTGILPNSDQGDIMRMQKMLIHVVDYDAIVTVEPFTTLLNMVRAFDPDNEKK